jgi:O-antigen biosynthesis protein WbqP
MESVYGIMKRIFDALLAAIGIIVLSPLFLVLAIAIRLDSPGPVLFRQTRIGLRKSHFDILKLRTMRIDTPKDTPTHLLEDPRRWVTSVGRFLRKTSLDELPQLFNILAGHMAIVGPRPALWNQLDLVAERDKWGANDLRPGLTGWAQVNGRDRLSIEEKAKYDGEYARRMGLAMDVRCLVLTVVRVVTGDGIS